MTYENGIEFIFRNAVHRKPVKSILRFESFNRSFLVICEMVQFVPSYSICDVMRQLILTIKIVSLCARMLGSVIMAIYVHIYIGIFKENAQHFSCRRLP